MRKCWHWRSLSLHRKIVRSLLISVLIAREIRLLTGVLSTLDNTISDCFILTKLSLSASEQKLPLQMVPNLSLEWRKTLWRRREKAVMMSGNRSDPETKPPSPGRQISSTPPSQTYSVATSGRPWVHISTSAIVKLVLYSVELPICCSTQQQKKSLKGLKTTAEL